MSAVFMRYQCMLATTVIISLLFDYPALCSPLGLSEASGVGERDLVIGLGEVTPWCQSPGGMHPIFYMKIHEIRPPTSYPPPLL